jgi:arylsulfatase
VVERYKLNDMTYKVHFDGFNFVPYLTGQAPKGPRESFFYFSHEGNLMALRYYNWKLAFAVQPAEGTMRVWQQVFEHPELHSSSICGPIRSNRRRSRRIRIMTGCSTTLFLMVPAQAYVGQFLATFKDYPPRQKAASFSIGQVLDKLSSTHQD